MSTFDGHRQHYTYSTRAYPIMVLGGIWICPRLAGRLHDVVEVARERNPNRLRLFAADGTLLGLARRIRQDAQDNEK